ncbi:hypothetical protein Smar_1408 [Staphylothermus marinus F1]|uniref:Uncharacterized protein n=1 Tax=Staphylothermus marinus (strain ATCC 43588 / DSM 3639 / JCM 9404 / F1) TaxID=399550 RepID=A3DPD8_STAMF|nr:hypothetical protein [Staphylothermus marinus]ABN70498.1 hypothetical protein Smar_1408 [Staphylothermus marinus F1]
MKSTIHLIILIMVLMSALIISSLTNAESSLNDQLVYVDVHINHYIRDNNITINFVVIIVNNYNSIIELDVLKHPQILMLTNNSVVYSNRYVLYTEKLLVKPGKHSIVNISITSKNKFDEIIAYSGRYLVVVNGKALFSVEEQKRIRIYLISHNNQFNESETPFSINTIKTTISTSKLQQKNNQKPETISYVAIPIVNTNSSHLFSLDYPNSTQDSTYISLFISISVVFFSLMITYKIYILAIELLRK